MEIIQWMMCKCYVWPIVKWYSVGTCGRCDTRPNKVPGLKNTKEAYTQVFETNFGKIKPMGA